LTDIFHSKKYKIIGRENGCNKIVVESSLHSSNLKKKVENKKRIIGIRPQGKDSSSCREMNKTIWRPRPYESMKAWGLVSINTIRIDIIHIDMIYIGMICKNIIYDSHRQSSSSKIVSFSEKKRLELIPLKYFIFTDFNYFSLPNIYNFYLFQSALGEKVRIGLRW